MALSVTYLHHVQCNAQGGMDSKKCYTQTQTLF